MARDCCVHHDVHSEVDPVARFSAQVLLWFGGYVCLSLMDLLALRRENLDPSGICRGINMPASRMKANEEVHGNSIKKSLYN